MNCKFNVFLTLYDITIVDRDVTHFGVGMIRSKSCSDQDGPSVVICNEAMIDVSKAMFGCRPDTSETIFGCILAWAHA